MIRSAMATLLFASPTILAQAQQPATHDMSNMPGMQMPASSVPNPLASINQQQPMKLAQFEQSALAHNPTLTQSMQIVERSGGQARQAGLLPNPTVGYQGEQIRGGSQGGGEQGGFIQQTIPLGGKLGLRRRVFEEQQRVDEFGAAEQRYRVLASVDQAFYTALAAQQTVAVRQELLALTQDALATARQLANVGQADAPDVLQSEVEVEQAQVEYTAAQYDFIREFGSLAALTGQPELPVARLEGDLESLPEIDTTQIVQIVLRNSPSVRRAQQELVRAETALNSARREPVPDLQLRAGLQQNFEPLSEGRSSNMIGAQGFATVGITLPVFNRNQGNIAAAAAEIERARAEVFRIQLSLREAMQPVLQTFLSEQMRAQRYKNQVIPRAERAYQLYLSKYRQMASAYPQVIVSQRTLLQLRITYVEALRNAWMDVILMRNYLLDGGLDPGISTGSASTSLNLPGGGGSPE